MREYSNSSHVFHPLTKLFRYSLISSQGFIRQDGFSQALCEDVLTSTQLLTTMIFAVAFLCIFHLPSVKLEPMSLPSFTLHTSDSSILALLFGSLICCIYVYTSMAEFDNEVDFKTWKKSNLISGQLWRGRINYSIRLLICFAVLIPPINHYSKVKPITILPASVRHIANSILHWVRSHTVGGSGVELAPIWRLMCYFM